MRVSQTPTLKSKPLPTGACRATYACLTAKSALPEVKGECVLNAVASGPARMLTLYPAPHWSAASTVFSRLSSTTLRLKPSALLGLFQAYPGTFALPVPKFHCAEVSTYPLSVVAESAVKTELGFSSA